MRKFTEGENLASVRRVIPGLVQMVAADATLSLNARLFGAFLATISRVPETTDQDVISLAATRPGLSEEEAAGLFAELEARGYMERHDHTFWYMCFVPAVKSPQGHLDYWKALYGPRDWFAALLITPPPFTETVAALRFSTELQPYYSEICSAMLRLVPGFVVPENVERIQTVLNEVSGSMEAGKIDSRGPVGIIVANLRGQAQIPPRDFSEEEEGEGEDEDEEEQV